jgi:hypothetical protein
MGDIDMREMQVMVVCECRSCVVMQGNWMIEEDEFEEIEETMQRDWLFVIDGFRDLAGSIVEIRGQRSV